MPLALIEAGSDTAAKMALHRTTRIGSEWRFNPLVRLLTLFFLLAGIVEFVRFLRHALFFFDAGITGDGALYFGMGRGLLNGLGMYTDLFETKPPAVFWVSALSLFLSKNDFPYRVLHAAFLAALPFVLALACAHSCKAWDPPRRRLCVALGFLFGSAIASFAADRGLGYQTEGFGILPAIIALALLAGRPDRARWRLIRILSAALALSVAVLFKEPFAVSIAAGMLLLSSSRRDLRDCVAVVALGILFWLGTLLATGTVAAYFAIYLPEMLGGRVTENLVYHHYGIDEFFVAPAPLWLRGINILKLLRDFLYDAQVPFFGLGIAALFLTYPAAGAGERKRPAVLLVGAALVACLILLLNLAFALEQVVAMLQFVLPFHDPFFRRKCLELAGLGLLTALLGCALAWLSVRAAVRAGVAILALYLAMLAVASGGDFAPHHFLFAVPVYAACFLALVKHASGPRGSGWTAGALGLAGCFLVVHAFLPRYDYHALSQVKASDIAAKDRLAEEAGQLDQLLTACRFSRYFVAEDLPSLHLMTHSPYQLSYGRIRSETQRARYFSDQQPNPFFRAKLLRDFAETPIIVRGSDPQKPFPHAALQEEFETHFSPEPPPCAEPFLPIREMRVFFRNDSAVPLT